MSERRSREARSRVGEEQVPSSKHIDAIGKVVGNIAHDFNNILLTIMGADHLLLDRLDEADPRRKYALDIPRACDRAAGLTRQLLAFSRRQVLQPTTVDLNDVVQDAVPMLERLVGARAELVVELESPRWRVRVDRGQMGNVIQALVSNARDAMAEGGTIWLRTRSVNLEAEPSEGVAGLVEGLYHVCLSVEDTGRGMDASTVGSLFDPSFTTKRDESGAGMGLPTVYGIVKQSGGVVTVSSRPGSGSTFNVYLPRCEDATQEIDPITPEEERLDGTETILIVEDEPIVHELCGEILAEYGYALLHAHDGQEALLVSQGYDGPIHLVISDVVMPGMGGREVAKRLRLERPELRVLFMSGYASRDDRRPESRDGRVGFLPKPFAPVELARTVKAILNAD